MSVKKKKKKLRLRSFENYSNSSAYNFKKVLDLNGSTPEPAIRSSDTSQRIPVLTAVN